MVNNYPPFGTIVKFKMLDKWQSRFALDTDWCIGKIVINDTGEEHWASMDRDEYLKCCNSDKEFQARVCHQVFSAPADDKESGLHSFGEPSQVPVYNLANIQPVDPVSAVCQFEQGDTVKSIHHGEGTVIVNDDNDTHPILVAFKYPPRYVNYTINGCEAGHEGITLHPDY